MARFLICLWVLGMLLVVGCGTSASSTPTATTVEPTATATPLPTPTATPSAAPQETVHIVQPGDTLSKLAETYKTTVEAIQKANNLKDPNVIVVGQKLVIPK